MISMGECCCEKKREGMRHELHEAREGIVKGIAGKPKFNYSEAERITKGAKTSLVGLKKV